MENNSYYPQSTSKQQMYPYGEGYSEYYNSSSSYPPAPTYNTVPLDTSIYHNASGYSEYPATSQYLPVQTPAQAYVGYPQPLPSYSVQQAPALTVSDYSIEVYPQMNGASFVPAPVAPMYPTEIPAPESYSPYDHSQDEDSGNGERKFQCSYSMCPMRFKRRRDLSRHETSVHRNERMYICDGTLSETDSRLKHCQCGRAFNRKDNLRNHLKPRAGRFSSSHSDDMEQ